MKVSLPARVCVAVRVRAWMWCRFVLARVCLLRKVLQRSPAGQRDALCVYPYCVPLSVRVRVCLECVCECIHPRPSAVSSLWLLLNHQLGN